MLTRVDRSPLLLLTTAGSEVRGALRTHVSHPKQVTASLQLGLSSLGTHTSGSCQGCAQGQLQREQHSKEVGREKQIYLLPMSIE